MQMISVGFYTESFLNTSGKISLPDELIGQGHLLKKSFLDLMAEPGSKSFSTIKMKNKRQVKSQIKWKEEDC